MTEVILFVAEFFGALLVYVVGAGFMARTGHALPNMGLGDD